MNWITKLKFNHPIQNPTLKSKARNKTELKLTYFLYPKEIKKKQKETPFKQKKKKKKKNWLYRILVRSRGSYNESARWVPRKKTRGNPIGRNGNRFGQKRELVIVIVGASARPEEWIEAWRLYQRRLLRPVARVRV